VKRHKILQDFLNFGAWKRFIYTFTKKKTKSGMKKIYYLSTCSTCTRILKEVNAEKKGVTLQDIKTEKISPKELDEMKEKAGSYEALFSRRAIKYKERGLKDKVLHEKDYRGYLLEEYTFLKRPVALIGSKIFVGNEKKTVEELKKALG
jgi:arsenate reductase